MQDMATTIRQARNLINWGVEEASADMEWFAIHNSEPQLSPTRSEDNPYAICPAWSLAALAKLLPPEIDGLYVLRIERDNGHWDVSYRYVCNPDLIKLCAKQPKLTDAIYDMIYQLLTNKFELRYERITTV